jgi:hypothetical protein
LSAETKRIVAVSIALQTQVLKTCPIHNQIYLDDEANPASAFALAIELVHQAKPFVQEFDHDEHQLTDLLSDTLGSSPLCCPDCEATLAPVQPIFLPVREFSSAAGVSG